MTVRFLGGTIKKGPGGLLVNSTYPVDYFALARVADIQFPDNSWWASIERFASVDANENYLAQVDGGRLTQEFLEIDLGRTRSINYLNFDILRAPISIKVEYDALSSTSGPTVWVPVKQRGEMQFDTATRYDATVRTAWFNAELSFTDPKGNQVNTRRLRITFTRRDELWPTQTSAPFRWPVFVKHLRLGQFVAEEDDTIGSLFTGDAEGNEILDLPNLDDTTSREVRQRFIISPDNTRGGEIPGIIGFGFKLDALTGTIPSLGDDFVMPPSLESVDYGWRLLDYSNPAAPVLIQTGTEQGVVTSGTSWLDIFLPKDYFIPGDTASVYELQLWSRNTLASNRVYLSPNNTLSQLPLIGNLHFILGSATVATSEDLRPYVSPGDYIVRSGYDDQSFRVTAVGASTITISAPYPQADGISPGYKVYPMSYYDEGTGAYVLDASKNLVMRLWGDVGASGKDILGNSYRYVVHRESAANVFDGTKAGWMSDPMPSTDAVEALYFDVRDTNVDDGRRIYRILDAIRIAPRTPGVKMNIYYSKDGLQGGPPVTRDEWDYLLWTPVSPTTYTLRRNEIIEFPLPIRAAFIKLEFTSLNPLPINLPIYPALPPKVYHRYPTWIEAQYTNSLLRNTVEDWWLRDASPVQIDVLSNLTDPVLEFEYKEAEFFAALASGNVPSSLINAQLVNTTERSVIDPVTGSKIYVQGINPYTNSLLLSVDRDSVLGRAVVARYDPTTVKDPVEHVNPLVPLDPIPGVSTAGDRITDAYAFLAQIPMQFNQTCRHVYRVQEGEYNKKAFFVGIDEVQFLRNDKTIGHDDLRISDYLYDDDFMARNTWRAEDMTHIGDPATVYVSYRIGLNEEHVDEEVLLEGQLPWLLKGRGGVIYNIRVHDLPENQGLEYFQNDDYQISLGKDEDGLRTYYINRSNLFERFIVPEQPIVYVDAAVVVGLGHIPSPPSDDSATVTGLGLISADEGLGVFIPTYDMGVFGSGTYADMHQNIADASTSTGVGVPITTDEEYIP